MRIKFITLILIALGLLSNAANAFSTADLVTAHALRIEYGIADEQSPLAGSVLLSGIVPGHDFLLGAFYGILLIAALYSLVAVIYYRKAVFGYYLSYVLSLILLVAVADQRILDGEFVQEYLYPVILYGVICCFLLFAQHILAIRKSFPMVNKLINLYFVVRAVILAGFLFFADARLSVYPDIFPFLLIFAISILSYRQGYKPALLFVLSYLLPLACIILRFTGNTYLIPDMEYDLYICSVTQVVILGMALAGKTNKGDRSEELDAALNAEVEKRVKYKMKDLLVQKTHLEDRLKNQDTFILKVTHDLKGPLRSIAGLVKSAKMDKTNDPEIYYDYIIKSSERLDTVISDLLTITRVTGKELTITPIDFKAMILEIADSLRGNIDRDAFEIEINIPQQEVFESEHVLLYSVFQNIIENAMNYRNTETEAKSYLRITLEDAGDYVRIHFKDNGIGIPEEFKNRIFEMFYRVDERHNHKSTGLGLYMVRLALDRLDSRVEVISEVGVGTCFTLILKNFHQTAGQLSDKIHAESNTE